MYRAKSNGRGEAVWFELRFQDDLVQKHRMEADLRRALSVQEFSVHYQPIIDTRRGGASCCEALVRWRHPERGMVSPVDFIPLAEETGLIVEIGEWVLRQACRDAMSWPSHVRVAVNLAPRQFQAPNLISMIAAALADLGLDPARLELEITELTLMQDTSEVSRKLARIRAMGLRLSLDDFGTGYSSLGYLNCFPINKIKIDRSFTIQLVGCPKTLAIVRAIAHFVARPRHRIGRGRRRNARATRAPGERECVLDTRISVQSAEAARGTNAVAGPIREYLQKHERRLKSAFRDRFRRGSALPRESRSCS